MVSLLLAWMIVGRVLTSSASAALQKRMSARGLSPTTVFAAAIGVMALMVLPVLRWYPLTGLPRAFWIYVGLAVLLDVPGNILLTRSFHEGELSVVGALAAYKPAIGLVFAALWLGETPSWMGLLGVAVVLSGSMFLAPGGRPAGLGALRALMEDPGARWRALSIALTAIQTVFGKAAINLSSAMDLFLAWSFASAVVAVLIWVWIWRAGWRGELLRVRAQWGSVVWLAALFLVLALLSSLIFERMFVGYALALFQLSALVNVALGWKMFAEGHTVSRAFASGVMVAGAAILILLG